MRNKVEILRALEFTKDDLENIKNLGEFPEFSAFDREFMEEFKKVYELGLNQLNKFINKLVSEGSTLDVFSIRYYVSQLLSGPLGKYTASLASGKQYFINIPDILGRCGNKEVNNSNTSIIPNTPTPLGQTIDVYNKIPRFLQDMSIESNAITENVFKNGMVSTTCMDNTLPLSDKRPQARISSENSGSWQSGAHGTYCVRDRAFNNVLNQINSDIFNTVNTYLGDENYRIYFDKKIFNPFDSLKNTSRSSNSRVLVNINGELVETDLMGDIYDSFERRKSSLKVETETKNVEYKLSTNKGQLGIQK